MSKDYAYQVRLGYEQAVRLARALKIVIGDVEKLPDQIVTAAERNRRLLDEYAELRLAGRIKTTVTTEYKIERTS